MTENERPFSALDPDEAVSRLHSDRDRGLSEDTVEKHREEHGPNQLREALRFRRTLSDFLLNPCKYSVFCDKALSESVLGSLSSSGSSAVFAATPARKEAIVSEFRNDFAASHRPYVGHRIHRQSAR